MKTRRTIEGTSKGKLTEEAYTLSNPPRARLLGVWMHEPIASLGSIELVIEEYIAKVRVIFRIRGVTDSGADAVREFTLDHTTAGQELELNYLNGVEFWRGIWITIWWNGSTLRVEFGEGFGDTDGDVILYEAF